MLGRSLWEVDWLNNSRRREMKWRLVSSTQLAVYKSLKIIPIDCKRIRSEWINFGSVGETASFFCVSSSTFELLGSFVVWLVFFLGPIWFIVGAWKEHSILSSDSKNFPALSSPGGSWRIASMGQYAPLFRFFFRVLFTDFYLFDFFWPLSLSFLAFLSPFKLIRTFYLHPAMTSWLWPFLFYSIFMDIWLLQMVLLSLHALFQLFNSSHSSRHARFRLLVQPYWISFKVTFTAACWYEQ